jgi:hypothetical protein
VLAESTRLNQSLE